MPYTAEYWENILSSLARLQESLRENMKTTAEICYGASALLSEYRCAVEKILQFQTDPKRIAALSSVLEGFTVSIGSLKSENQLQEVPVLNYEKTKETLDRVKPYVEKVDDSGEKTSVLEKFKSFITPGMILDVISILITVIVAIINSLPNEQLDEIIEQNEIALSKTDCVISQNDEIINGMKRKSGLDEKEVVLLDQIVEAIEDLSSSLDVLSEHMQDPDNSIKENGDP